MTHCPKCGAPLADPNEAFCATCGAPISPPAMSEPQIPTPPPLPASTPTEVPFPPPPTAKVDRPGVPWEDPSFGGWLDRLVETTKRVLTAPTGFFSGLPAGGGMLLPLAYALILGSLGAWIGLLYDTVFREAIAAWLPGFRDRYSELFPAVGRLASALIGAVLAPILVAVQLFLLSGVVHLALLLLGGARKGFDTTFRTAAYSVAPTVVALVPFCGSLVAVVWSVFLLILGLAASHGTSKGIAAAAVLLPLILLCCLCAGSGFLAAMVVSGLLQQLAT